MKTRAEQVLWGETDKAMKIRINGKEAWIPKSICVFISDENQSGKGDISGELDIPEWLYQKSFN